MERNNWFSNKNIYANTVFECLAVPDVMLFAVLAFSGYFIIVI